jgi:glycosyltransferase involved in cell wall biosynthesis
VAVRALIIAEYYPRAGDPVRGVWAHRQAVATRDAGAEVRVLVLHRPVPPRAALRRGDIAAIGRELRQPATAQLDGIRVEYLRYLSPPRPWSYATWGAWAAPLLARRLRRMASECRFDLVHAHYAVPAGDAVCRAAVGLPLVLSVHGHDVYGDGPAMLAVPATLAHAALVMANSAGTARRCEANGASLTRVVHLGTDVPDAGSAPPLTPTLVTVGHLVARKRHTDVIAALALLGERDPPIRYVVVGDGPERERLRTQAAALGVAHAVEFRGQLPHARAVATARAASLFVMPSIDEAFGVAYVEAMAAGVPAVGCAGEDGPTEIAAAGGGIALVAPRDPGGLAAAIDALISDQAKLEAAGREARQTVVRSFTWQRCGRDTVAAYEEALRP